MLGICAVGIVLCCALALVARAQLARAAAQSAADLAALAAAGHLDALTAVTPVTPEDGSGGPTEADGSGSPVEGGGADGLDPGDDEAVTAEAVTAACALAGTVAQRNGSELSSCAHGGDVTVSVVVTRQVAGIGEATAAATAGRRPP